jgi:hypothetical protein
MDVADVCSLIGNLCGFASGALLVRSSFRVNRLLKDASELRRLIAETQSGLEKATFDAMREKSKDQAGEWKDSDQRNLYLGTVLLVVSFAFSVLGTLLKPECPTAKIGSPQETESHTR